jgi:hypothetical protein
MPNQHPEEATTSSFWGRHEGIQPIEAWVTEGNSPKTCL